VIVMFHKWSIGMALAAIATIAAGPSPRAAQPDDEQQIGQQVFNELKTRAEIISTSPLYDVLTPVTAAIARTAQPRYNHPFKFYLVHEPQPNAFATPGGNVYVTDALLYFVRNKEELAGTLCHEVSHTIHHDSMNLIQKERQLERRELGAAILLGPSAAHMLAIGCGSHGSRHLRGERRQPMGSGLALPGFRQRGRRAGAAAAVGSPGQSPSRRRAEGALSRATSRIRIVLSGRGTSQAAGGAQGRPRGLPALRGPAALVRRAAPVFHMRRYLLTLKGSQQEGLTGVKGSMLRKIVVDKTRSSLESALAYMKQPVERSAPRR
jgi:hypothetical protein